MHRIAFLLVAVFLSASATASDQAPTETGRTCIKAGRLLDAAGGRILSDRVITIAAGRVEAVGDSGTAIPPDAHVIDLSNAFVLPGLIDMQMPRNRGIFLFPLLPHLHTGADPAP